MRKKWIALSVVLLGSCVLFYFLFLMPHKEKQILGTHLCLQGSYFKPVKITKYSSQIPCVDIRIGEKTTTAKVDLGFCGDIGLPGIVIKELNDKSFVRRSSYFGIRGIRYDCDVYELPKIIMGGMVLFRAKARETNPEFEKDAIILRDEESPPENNLGSIGWRLFYNFNFFLDCDNSIIAFCDSLDTLKQQGYPVDAFIETPLLLDRNLIEFDAITEFGPMRCMLDTGCTLNILNKNVEGGVNDHMIFNPDTIDQHEILNPANSDQMIFDPEDVYGMTVFKIANKDFGSVTFQKMKTPFDIDAIIGMDFLDSKLLFIDFPKRKIYFYKK